MLYFMLWPGHLRILHNRRNEGPPGTQWHPSHGNHRTTRCCLVGPPHIYFAAACPSSHLHRLHDRSSQTGRKTPNQPACEIPINYPMAHLRMKPAGQPGLIQCSLACIEAYSLYVVVSPNKGAPYIDPKILESVLWGPPNKIPPILGNPYVS